MPMHRLTRRETPWIASDARYVYRDSGQQTCQAALTYSLVRRRMLDRIEDDMMRAVVEQGGRRVEILGNSVGALASTVRRMDALAQAIVNTDGRAFDFERREDGKLIRVEERALARYYPHLRSLVLAVVDPELNLSRFKLPAYAQLFHDVAAYYMDRFPILHECLAKLPTYFDTTAHQFSGEIADGLFDLLRREARVRGAATEDVQRTFDANRRLRRMQRFTDDCFSRSRTLFVMRIECAYRPPERPEQTVTVQLEQTKGHHATFVNRLRASAKFAAVAVGGIWSLGWGEYKGHHYRWTFLLDGELVFDAAEWAELVAEVWTDVVRDDAAYVRIPGVNDAPAAVTGLLRVDDVEKMKLLRDELEYLAFSNNLIQLKEADGARSWGTWVPANTRGDRRRKALNDVSGESGAERCDKAS